MKKVKDLPQRIKELKGKSRKDLEIILDRKIIGSSNNSSQETQEDLQISSLNSNNQQGQKIISGEIVSSGTNEDVENNTQRKIYLPRQNTFIEESRQTRGYVVEDLNFRFLNNHAQNNLSNQSRGNSLFVQDPRAINRDRETYYSKVDSEIQEKPKKKGIDPWAG